MRKAAIAVGLAGAAGLAAWQAGLFPVLSSVAKLGRQPEGFYLLPTNQLLKPWGEQALIQGRPVDAAFDSKKRLLAVLNWRSVLLLDGKTGAAMSEVKSRSTSYTGLAFRPGDRELWASETTRNGPDSLLMIMLDANGKPVENVGFLFEGHPVPAGIAFSADGARAYIALSRNNTLAVMDVASKTILREVPVGMAPFGVAVANGKVFVSNRAGRRARGGETVAPSSGSEVLTDARTGATVSGTVSVIDEKTFQVRDIDVGLAPSAVAASADGKRIAVANGHSDTVSLLDTATLARTDVKIPSYPEGLGSQPVTVTFAPDGRKLYVGCGGINAVGVVALAGGAAKFEGSVPTGWFPSALAVDGEGGLRVVNIKGVGSTDNQKGAFTARAYEGSLLRLPSPAPAQLAAGTREVRAANSPKFQPAGGVSNLASLGIRHVFFIIKENRTYDQVFGDMPKGNGDPKLVMYGRDVTPNHHALAEKYVLLDNFYTGGAISFDGHQWLMMAFVSDYVERAFAASPRGYAWNMADALTVAPTGFFWQGGPRPLSVRIYGEFSLPAKWDPVKRNVVDIDEDQMLSWSEYWRHYKAGTWRDVVGSKCGVPALAPYYEERFPPSSMLIPDQIRAEAYLRELTEREKSGDMPALSIFTLPTNHTNGTRPGSPRPRSMVADNDLALGRIVEGISKSRFWPNSLILVVEDDAQDGIDHVDGHRTLALAIGPHIRRGALDSNHYNHLSMVRTIQEILRVPPSTRYLAAARSMTSVFTAERDLSAYQAIVPAIALDDMNPPLKALKGRQLWAARQSAAMNWDEPDDVPQDVLNRILWWDSKGWETPYPSLPHHSTKGE